MRSAFWAGFDRRRDRDRQSRLDLLTERMMRGQMALREAADVRQERALQERLENAQVLRDRMGYQDRMSVLKRDTAPLQTLLGKYPEAGASPYTTEANRFDELLAREPGKAEERIPLAAPWAPDQQPTNREERSRNIGEAYDRFGGAAEAQRKALESLKLRLKGTGGSPFTRDLDIKLRGLEAKKKQAQAMINGQQVMPNGMLVDIMDPGARQKAKEQGQRMLAAAVAEESALNSAYAGRSGQVSPAMGPAAVAAQLESQGMDADAIAAQLEQMFSPEELAVFGQGE